MIGEDESHSNKRSRYDDDLTSYLRNRTHDDNGVAIPTQKSAPSAKYLKLLAQENERDRKYGKKPKNLTERIKLSRYNNLLGDPYKDLAVDMHKLTHQIDTKETSTSKMDPKDPATFPRSIKLDIELGAPDSHKEKEEFRELSENFKAVKLKFQEDIAPCSSKMRGMYYRHFVQHMPKCLKEYFSLAEEEFEQILFKTLPELKKTKPTVDTAGWDIGYEVLQSLNYYIIRLTVDLEYLALTFRLKDKAKTTAVTLEIQY
eukprot:CAMPEP_0178980938 /NCGR_PEP_ID=MMETSP0789-20121207/26781_1 /TAXON_ID=3005 /ORGANISM="Rhizosolenia setigera, Strain CCMP 1694" /LENGTH=258 /DNA_ID=CAMNT_0020671421 /DNA_START=1269 /DNA_END=2045 /DNA_ORIENTATION=-